MYGTTMMQIIQCKPILTLCVVNSIETYSINNNTNEIN